MRTLLPLAVVALAACGGPKDNLETAAPGDPTDSEETVDTEDTADTMDTVDTEDTQDTVVTGDTEDTDDTAPPMYDEGPVDAYSEAACALVVGKPVPLMAVALESEAGQALALPADDTVYELSWDHEGDAWFTIEVPDWEIEERMFMDQGVSYEILGGAGVEPMADLAINGACPETGQTDGWYKFHSWGSFTVRIDEGSPNPFRMVLIKVEE